MKYEITRLIQPNVKYQAHTDFFHPTQLLGLHPTQLLGLRPTSYILHPSLVGVRL